MSHGGMAVQISYWTLEGTGETERLYVLIVGLLMLQFKNTFDTGFILVKGDDSVKMDFPSSYKCLKLLSSHESAVITPKRHRTDRKFIPRQSVHKSAR